MASDLNLSHIDGRSMSALTKHLLCSQEPETYKSFLILKERLV